MGNVKDYCSYKDDYSGTHKIVTGIILVGLIILVIVYIVDMNSTNTTGIRANMKVYTDTISVAVIDGNDAVSCSGDILKLDNPVFDDIIGFKSTITNIKTSGDLLITNNDSNGALIVGGDKILKPGKTISLIYIDNSPPTLFFLDYSEPIDNLLTY